MKQDDGWNKLEQFNQILEEGTKDEMLALEGTNLWYCIYSDMSGMDIFFADEQSGYQTHSDGYFGDYACLKILGHYHDFRTDEQKKGFTYRLSISPWFSTNIDVSIVQNGNAYELYYSSGVQEKEIKETIALSAQDFKSFFSTVKPDELLEFSLMDDFNGLLGVRGYIYINGETNHFHYPVHIKNRIGQYISASILLLLDQKLQNHKCREKLEEVKKYFDNAIFFSWEPDEWFEIKDRGYLTNIYDDNIESWLKVGDSFVDDSGQRYMVRGIESFTRPMGEISKKRLNHKGVVLRPLGKHGEEKPERLHYISG